MFSICCCCCFGGWGRWGVFYFCCCCCCLACLCGSFLGFVVVVVVVVCVVFYFILGGVDVWVCFVCFFGGVVVVFPVCLFVVLFCSCNLTSRLEMLCNCRSFSERAGETILQALGS